MFSDPTIKNGLNSGNHHLYVIWVSYENPQIIWDHFKQLLGNRRNDILSLK